MLSLSRYQLEKVTVKRCKAVMTRAGLATVCDPLVPNDDLDDPIATALENLGVFPADRTAVTDADLASLGTDLQARLIDQVEIRTLETALQQVTGKPRSQQWEDYKVDQGNPAADLADLVKSKWQQYFARYSNSGVIGITPMNPAITNTLDTSGYFPI